MPPEDRQFSFFLRNAKWFLHLIFFNLTTSWWGSSVLIYRWDLKDSPSWHKECRKKWRHKLWKLDSLDLRKRGAIPTSPHGIMRKMDMAIRQWYLCPPQTIGDEMSSWEKDRKSDPDKTVQCAVYFRTPTQIFSFLLLWRLYPLPLLSALVCPPCPHQTQLLDATLRSSVVKLNACVLTSRISIT